MKGVRRSGVPVEEPAPLTTRVIRVVAIVIGLAVCSIPLLLLEIILGAAASSGVTRDPAWVWWTVGAVPVMVFGALIARRRRLGSGFVPSLYLSLFVLPILLYGAVIVLLRPIGVEGEAPDTWPVGMVELARHESSLDFGTDDFTSDKQYLNVALRIRPGQSVDEASEEVAEYLSATADEDGPPYYGGGFAVSPLVDAGDTRPQMSLLTFVDSSTSYAWLERFGRDVIVVSIS